MTIQPRLRIAVAGLLFGLLLVLSGCGSGGSTQSTTPGGEPRAKLRNVDLQIDSRAVGSELEVDVIDPEPQRAGARPLLVFLHGLGGSNMSFFAHDPVVRSALAELGAEAPVVAIPDGKRGWWHDRASGDWERYVMDEVIPLAQRRFHTDPERVAIGGISMGGYGAYHLGLRHPGRFCAVGGHSPGLWQHRGEEFEGAFDNREDWERNGVIAAVRADPDAFGDTRIWNDYGKEDWFVPGDEAFAAALGKGDADLTAHVWPGGHDYSYWNVHFPQYLDFYAEALADC